MTFKLIERTDVDLATPINFLTHEEDPLAFGVDTYVVVQLERQGHTFGQRDGNSHL